MHNTLIDFFFVIAGYKVGKRAKGKGLRANGGRKVTNYELGMKGKRQRAMWAKHDINQGQYEFNSANIFVG